MKVQYTDEKNILILLSLLKGHGIKKVVASPGTTNISFVRSLQNDPYFEVYSVVDERSAAYMACGLSAESNEVVILSCTGATASRNYMSGLTEAYYRKLPVLSVTSSQDIARVGHHIAQVIDRSVMPNDVVKHSVTLPVVKDDDDWWSCEVKINNAILELNRNGGGPVHINLVTKYSKNFNIEKLPNVRIIKRFGMFSEFPKIPQNGRIAVFLGSHITVNQELSKTIDDFCRCHDAVVFCDHTSGYYGTYKVNHCLSSSQRLSDCKSIRPYLSIHIGEISGDYSSARVIGKNIWRVSEDGELRDTFRKLEYVFEMPEIEFFKYYVTKNKIGSISYLKECREHLSKLNKDIPELPFSNYWIAKVMHNMIPKNSTIHFGILNSLRAWNFFELPNTVQSSCNVGGFGIDGCVSALIGASLAKKNKLFFGVVGDLAYFYDMNSIGNRHVGDNLRILLINNGKGAEFRNFNHPGAVFGESADEYIAAGGHFGNKSKKLVKNYCENLGFEYLTASNKSEFEKVYKRFIVEKITEKPMLFEVFTDCNEESKALELITSFVNTSKDKTKRLVKGVFGDNNIKIIKNIMNK
jgi:2-succinyl-5-enolpyruvyl-6-hydroxy-3-cyclohexene-1-carboxylate synthase